MTTPQPVPVGYVERLLHLRQRDGDHRRAEHDQQLADRDDAEDPPAPRIVRHCGRRRGGTGGGAHGGVPSGIGGSGRALGSERVARGEHGPQHGGLHGELVGRDARDPRLVAGELRVGQCRARDEDRPAPGPPSRARRAACPSAARSVTRRAAPTAATGSARRARRRRRGSGRCRNLPCGGQFGSCTWVLFQSAAIPPTGANRAITEIRALPAMRRVMSIPQLS